MTNGQNFGSIEFMDAVGASLNCSDVEKTMGQRGKDALRIHHFVKKESESRNSYLNAGQAL